MNSATDILTTGLSTVVIGMGIVFLTLAFLAFILSLLKYVDRKKEEPIPDTLPIVEGPAEEELEEAVAEEETDELELVAAITAAIAASLGTSSDKLRVVSIRRAEKAPWNQAARREQQRQVF